MSTLGERLAAERTRIGLNQTDFAALAGVGRASQVNYETGKRSPDAAYLAAVGAAGVDIQYVVLGRRCTAVQADPAEERARTARAIIKDARERLARALTLIS